MNEFIALGLWVLYCFLFGVYDGMQYYLNRKEQRLIDNMSPHPHAPAFLMRVMMGALLAFSEAGSTLGIFWDTFALGLMFPFLFDGTYYETRKRLDAPSGYHFFGMSTTSTGMFDLNPIQRTVAFVIGLGCYFLNHLIKTI